MRDIWNGSVVCRMISAIYSWFGLQWKDSRLINAFLRPYKNEPAVSVLQKPCRFGHRILCTLFEKISLNRLLSGSIFKRCFLWCMIAVVMAPILPTMAVLALTVVGTGSLILCFAGDRERHLVYAPVNHLLYLFAFVYIVATLTSVDLRGSLQGGLLTVFFMLFAIVFQNVVSSRRQLNVVMIGLVASGAFVALLGVFQYVFGLTGAEAWLDSDMFSEISMRVYSTLQNPNVLAEYLLLVIPLTVACFLNGKNGKEKFFYFCAGVVMLVCMMLTYSRGGWLGLLFAAAVFLIMLDRRFIIVGIVCLIGLYFVLPDTIINRFASIGNLGDGSTSYRVSIWLGTIAMLKDYWFCGIGPGTAAFNSVYPAYSHNTISAPHAHNLFLQVTCDTGICGLLIFLALLFCYLRYVCSQIARETDKKSKIFQMSAVSGMCGFLLQSMTDYSFYNYRVMLLFWVFFALGLLLVRRTNMPEGDKIW